MHKEDTFMWLHVKKARLNVEHVNMLRKIIHGMLVIYSVQDFEIFLQPIFSRKPQIDAPSHLF